jgi:hypothetical protein
MSDDISVTFTKDELNYIVEVISMQPWVKANNILRKIIDAANQPLVVKETAE